MKYGKVYGGLYFTRGEQRRSVIYEASQSRAAKAVGLSLYEFRRWSSVTGNDDEIKAAKERPGRLVVIG